MKIEHLALNVPDSKAMTDWYRDVLGMPVHVERFDPIHCAFLGEPPTLIELYHNPKAPCLPLSDIAPLSLHLALVSEDLAADTARLCEAGAVHLEGEPDPNGFGLVFLRCPWGLVLQLCRREHPLTV